MTRCLICGNELKGCLCPRCGFDLSLCAERYPTLGAEPRTQRSLGAERDRLFRAMAAAQLREKEPQAALAQAETALRPVSPASEPAPAEPAEKSTNTHKWWQFGPRPDQRRSGDKTAASDSHFLAPHRDQTLAAGQFFTAGILPDNEVVVTSVLYRKAERWTGVVSLAAGSHHLVGLRKRGTVVAVGKNDDGQCDVSGWRDVVAIAAGDWFTLGLRKDGTLVAAGCPSDPGFRLQIQDWKNVVAIAAGADHAVGLKEDGTVLAAGSNDYGRCDVSGWRNVVAVAAGNWFTLGLTAEHRVLAVGGNFSGACETGAWREIVSCSAGGDVSLGVDSHGRVLASGQLDLQKALPSFRAWEDVVLTVAGYNHVVGLRKDGSVLAVGSNCLHECQVADWRLLVPSGLG